MNIMDSIELTEKYAKCPECGCMFIGNGKGTLECDTEKGYFRRTCHCGWHIEIKEDDLLDYSELREEIHRILCDFFDYEYRIQNNGEFDFEYLEFRTDEILKLIKRQGGSA